MSTIFNQKIDLIRLLRQIPDEHILKIATKSKVDHYAKVLNGRLMFYLLLSGILRTDKLSQRGLADSFSSPLFRTLFNFKGKPTISHSSISDRLSTMNTVFSVNVTKQSIIYSVLYTVPVKSKTCVFSVWTVLL